MARYHYFVTCCLVCIVVLTTTVAIYKGTKGQNLLLYTFLQESTVVHTRIHLNEDTEGARKCDAAADCVHVIMAANRFYLVPLLASINSIQLNSKRPISLHFLVGMDDVEAFEAALSRIVNNIPIEIVAFSDKRVKNLIKVWDGLPNHASTLNYARFYLPELFPTVNETVYVDPDTLILDDLGSLIDKLHEPPYNINIIAAVPANLRSFVRSSYAFILNCQDPSIMELVDCSDEFFNAGVFVTNLNKWRDHNVTQESEKWMHLNTQRPLWKWGSQPPLNLVFYRRWSRLGAEWNFRGAGSENFDPEILQHVKIVHFTGKEKPWKIAGHMFWDLWCPFYPERGKLWFCHENPIEALTPDTLWDFSFADRLFQFP